MPGSNVHTDITQLGKHTINIGSPHANVPAPANF